jgi:hypothetical protein
MTHPLKKNACFIFIFSAVGNQKNNFKILFYFSQLMF